MHLGYVHLVHFYFNGKCRYKYSIVIIPEESRGLFQLMGTGDPISHPASNIETQSHSPLFFGGIPDDSKGKQCQRIDMR